MKVSSAAIPAIGVGFLAFLFFFGVNWALFYQFGDRWIAILALFGGFVWVFTAILACLSLFAALPKDRSKTAVLLFSYSASIAVFGFLGMRSADAMQMHEFRRLAERSGPLVQAIRSFEMAEERAPYELTELIPMYLDAVPGAGLGPCTEYKYQRLGQNQYGPGNDWILVVDCMDGLANIHHLVYLPIGDYSEYRFGHQAASIEGWAYFVD